MRTNRTSWAGTRLITNFFLYIIFLCGNNFQDILSLRPAYLLLGQKLDTISLVVMTLGVRVVLLFSEGGEFLANEPLS